MQGRRGGVVWEFGRRKGVQESISHSEVIFWVVLTLSCNGGGGPLFL